jgi:prepilin-type N-terminal cleavage/methylation domain-containing protein
MPLVHSAPASPRTRAGLTIIEVLAALVVVSVGLLGMAGTAAISLRTVAGVTRERRALRRLDFRLAALAAGSCSRAAGGAASDPRDSLREQWTVAASAAGAALVDARVEWREGARMRSITQRSAILC